MSKIAIYRIGNLASAAAQAALSSGSHQVRKSLYGSNMGTLPSDGGKEENYLRTIGAPDSHIYDNNIQLQTSDGTITELIGVKLNVKMNNKIAETALAARAGKVKEYIRRDDYKVTVNGDLVRDREQAFPYAMMEDLIARLSQEDSIEVSSRYLDLFGISQLVLQNADFKQEEQKYLNVMPFTLTFVSDIDYDFLVEE